MFRNNVVANFAFKHMLQLAYLVYEPRRLTYLGDIQVPNVLKKLQMSR